MAALSSLSLSMLDGVKPITRSRAIQLAEEVTRRGGDIGIDRIKQLRTPEFQAQLVKWRDDSVATGGAYYPVAPVGSSNHETGDAFDVDWNRAPAGVSMAVFQKQIADFAPSIGLRAGYYFGGGPPSRKSDPFHFENIEVDARGPKFSQVAKGVGKAGAVLALLFVFLTVTADG